MVRSVILPLYANTEDREQKKAFDVSPVLSTEVLTRTFQSSGVLERPSVQSMVQPTVGPMALPTGVSEPTDILDRITACACLAFIFLSNTTIDTALKNACFLPTLRCTIHLIFAHIFVSFFITY